MCVSSMVMDHYSEKPMWQQFTAPATFTPSVSRDEFEALRREVAELKGLLARANEYDRRTGQPECENSEKIALVRKVAEFVGININDVIETPNPDERGS